MVFLFYFCVLINLLIIMLEKLFGFNPKETTVKTEIMAGITTFLTMAYILAVNPNILGETGMDKGALFTTTVLMSALPTIFMALYAKLPLALAPGMGLNAFFAYTVCLIMGYSWQFALTAVFLEGIAFILLTVTNLREKIVEVIPPALKSAISAGIGLYIAFIGLKNAEVIVDNPATLVSRLRMPDSNAAEPTAIQFTSPMTAAVPMVATAVCATVLIARTAAAWIHVLPFFILHTSSYISP
jgi:xanthine/uracil/vitamin C permease (AzgA family)